MSTTGIGRVGHNVVDWSHDSGAWDTVTTIEGRLTGILRNIGSDKQIHHKSLSRGPDGDSAWETVEMSHLGGGATGEYVSREVVHLIRRPTYPAESGALPFINEHGEHVGHKIDYDLCIWVILRGLSILKHTMEVSEGLASKKGTKPTDYQPVAKTSIDGKVANGAVRALIAIGKRMAAVRWNATSRIGGLVGTHRNIAHLESQYGVMGSVTGVGALSLNTEER